MLQCSISSLFFLPWLLGSLAFISFLLCEPYKDSTPSKSPCGASRRSIHFASQFLPSEERNRSAKACGERLMSAMPVMIVVLCLMAIAYRFYSAFLAAKVAALDGARETPAYQFNDGHNFHPTNKWVLFGHHFAAI